MGKIRFILEYIRSYCQMRSIDETISIKCEYRDLIWDAYLTASVLYYARPSIVHEHSFCHVNMLLPFPINTICTIAHQADNTDPD